MAGYVIPVSGDQPENWELGRDNQIWAMRANFGIRAGDDLFFWKARHGLVAHARATQDAQPVQGHERLPWPDHVSQPYKWRFAVDVIHDRDDPVITQWSSVQELIGSTTQANRPAIQLDDVSLARFLELFSSDTWDLAPGDIIRRTELHERWGGRRQGGIGPSAQTPNVFLFSDPESGAQHGYVDDWQPDGFYHYTGEGQIGDQRMVSGNLQILNHVNDGRALRLFDGTSGVVTYVGEFALAADPSWYRTDAPQSGSEEIRTVIVFKLRPIEGKSAAPEPREGPTLAEHVVRQIPVEAHHTEEYEVNPAAEPRTATRTESALVARFMTFLARNGHVPVRQQIRPAGEAKSLYTDLYFPALKLLVEAKGTSTREAVRLAIGQLADYQRFLSVDHRAVLLATEPRSDLMDLLQAEDIALIWESRSGQFRGAGTGAEMLAIGTQV